MSMEITRDILPNLTVFRCQLWPNIHWTEDEAQQRLYALVQEGKLTEIEPGRYAPTLP
jgi:hypothetical protein